MAASAYTDTVQKVYIAYYGRAADPVGLAYWSSELDKVDGNLSAIMASFGASAEATTLYSSLSNTAMVNALFQQSFGRDADFAGLMYYAGQLSAGTMTAVSIAQNIFDGAAGVDATIVANKLIVAKAYTAAIDTASEVVAYSGTVAATSARTLLSTVDDATVTESFDVTTTVASVTSASTTAAAAAAIVPGQTFTLTTAVDAITGTVSADTIQAYVNTTTASVAQTTMTGSDTVNGGAGVDTINITLEGANAAGSLTAATFDAVEIFNIRDINTSGASTYAFGGVTGETHVNVNNSTAQVTLANVAAGTTIGVLGNGGTTNGATIVTYTGATATAALFDISGGTTAGAIGVTNATSGTAIAGLTINSKGAANTIGAFASTDTGIITTTIAAETRFLTTGLTVGTNAATQGLVVGGDAANSATAAAVTLGALDADFASINASGLTAGGISATLSSTVAATVTGGAGNDTITTSTNAQTGLVDAGAGTGDTLVIANAADVNTTAEGAIYTNFEILSLSENQVVSNMSGITAITVTDGGNTISGMNATQAANITLNATGATNVYSLTNATGTSDVITINLTSATATTNVDSATTSVIGFETVNINSTTGVAGTQNDFAFGANTADAVTAINVTGSAETTLVNASILDVAAVTIDASASTGAFSTSGVLLTGSTVTGSATAINTLGVSTTLGTTYTGGSANDIFNAATVADLVATGANDNKLHGGTHAATATIAGDGIVLAATTNTIIDNHFTFVTGMEMLTTSTSTTSITTGGAFNSAYADGATITSGTLADSTVYTLAAGLSNSDLVVSLDGTALTGVGNSEDITVTTGSGDDTVTLTGTAFIGATGAAASGDIVIATGSGADAISVSVGILAVDATQVAIGLTPGTGADTITKVGTNDGSATTDGFGKMSVTIADGDSLVGGRDVITGFDLATAALISDTLDFVNVGTVLNAGAANGTDSGTIKSHSTAIGVITFDDVDTFNAAVVVNSSNLSDITTYLTTNLTTAGTTVAFAYDSNGSGTADATMVYNAGVGANDSLVELVGVVATSLSATNATTNLMVDVSQQIKSD